MLLTKMKNPANETNKQKYSIKEVVKEAISKYPLNADERRLVHLDLTQNFEFYGNKTMFAHVLYNLLKNALYYIQQACRGNITNRTEVIGDKNRLYFRDTDKGVPKEMLPHMFERFYSKTEHGTGLGLAFCRLVMEDIDGKISCDSIYGEYIEFILEF